MRENCGANTNNHRKSFHERVIEVNYLSLASASRSLPKITKEDIAGVNVYVCMLSNRNKFQCREQLDQKVSRLNSGILLSV